MVVFSISLPRLSWRQIYRVAASFFSSFLLLSLLSQSVVAQINPERAYTPLVVSTQKGDFRFDVEIADTPQTRQMGLMFRRQMARDRGMLFIFPDETEKAFWMKNTYLSLDIIYIKSDGTVLSIARKTTPLSQATVPSNGKAQYVLELLGGMSEEIGLRAGDVISHKRINIK